jgi:hypothetical protein
MSINGFDPGDSRGFISQYARPICEVVILEDLYNFLLDPESEMAKQKIKYEIAD